MRWGQDLGFSGIEGGMGLELRLGGVGIWASMGLGGGMGLKLGLRCESRLRWGWDMGFSGIEGGMGIELGLRWN